MCGHRCVGLSVRAQHLQMRTRSTGYCSSCGGAGGGSSPSRATASSARHITSGMCLSLPLFVSLPPCLSMSSSVRLSVHPHTYRCTHSTTEYRLLKCLRRGNRLRHLQQSKRLLLMSQHLRHVSFSQSVHVFRMFHVSVFPFEPTLTDLHTQYRQLQFLRRSSTRKQPQQSKRLLRTTHHLRH